MLDLLSTPCDFFNQNSELFYQKTGLTPLLLFSVFNQIFWTYSLWFWPPSLDQNAELTYPLLLFQFLTKIIPYLLDLPLVILLVSLGSVKETVFPLVSSTHLRIPQLFFLPKLKLNLLFLSKLILSQSWNVWSCYGPI